MEGPIQIRKLPPVWFIRSLDAFRKMLIFLNRHLFPANVVLYEQFQYFWLLPCLKVAAEMDIAGFLEDGPRTIEEIAQHTGADPGSLLRIMRAMSSQGIFRQRKDGKFMNTSLSLPLADGKNSIRYMIRHHLGRINWNLVSELSYSVKTGKEAFPMIHGSNIYQYLSDHPDESSLFDRSMSDLSRMSVDPILNACDFSGFRSITDVGGGEGLLLAAILTKNNQASGILFDLPAATVNAMKIFSNAGVTGRVRIVDGNFFLTNPPESECYILKNVIHNWGDEDCLKILGNIRKVMPENGKVFIIEMIVNKGNASSFSKLIDIQMMVLNRGARERTLNEYSDLLKKAGLDPVRIHPTIAPISLIECSRSHSHD